MKHYLIRAYSEALDKIKASGGTFIRDHKFGIEPDKFYLTKKPNIVESKKEFILAEIERLQSEQ